MAFSCEVGKSMVAWAGSRAGCLHCALIALTIQGMTPDPRDLTSGSISRVLRSILGDGTPAPADEPPPADDATDELCTPASAAARVAARGRADDPSPPPLLLPTRRTTRA